MLTLATHRLVFRHLSKNWQPARFFRKNNPREPAQSKLSKSPLSRKADPTHNGSTNPNVYGFSRLVRPFLFTVGFSGSVFSAAAIWQYENMRKKAASIWKQKALNIQDQFERSVFGSVLEEKKKVGEWREALNRLWNDLPQSEKIFIPILVANVAVFLAWRVPAMKPLMVKYFTSSPAHEALCWPMLLSAFSHYSFFHLSANMFVLHSFCHPVIAALGKEQFLGLYLSSGVITAFFSTMFKVATKNPTYSLGASGAILSIVGVFGTIVPDAPLQILFLPMFTFTADNAIKGLMLFDTVGLFAKWTFFDHAAHLSGLFFGIWWVHQGNQLIWANRGIIMNLWHKHVRGNEGKVKPPTD